MTPGASLQAPVPVKTLHTPYDTQRLVARHRLVRRPHYMSFADIACSPDMYASYTHAVEAVVAFFFALILFTLEHYQDTGERAHCGDYWLWHQPPGADEVCRCVQMWVRTCARNCSLSLRARVFWCVWCIDVNFSLVLWGVCLSSCVKSFYRNVAATVSRMGCLHRTLHTGPSRQDIDVYTLCSASASRARPRTLQSAARRSSSSATSSRRTRTPTPARSRRHPGARCLGQEAARPPRPPMRRLHPTVHVGRHTHLQGRGGVPRHIL